ncbi:MAG: hypothetical protein AB7E66_10985, partial [Parvibaculaceae bacterium]
QAQQIEVLKTDLLRARGWAESLNDEELRPWDVLYRRAEAELGLEAQEYLVSTLIEPHGALVDDLCAGMCMPDGEAPRMQGSMSCGRLAELVRAHYGWALAVDFASEDANARFWYTSQEKLEPRLGWRGDDEGDELELPLGFAREVSRLHTALAGRPAAEPVSALAAARPELRLAIRRVQTIAQYPYGEIHDNLLGAEMRPVDLMRCKLSIFGAEAFDPRSNLSLRIRLFQDAPFPDELQDDRDVRIGW